MDKCYSPIWLRPEQSIRAAVVEFYANHLERHDSHANKSEEYKDGVVANSQSRAGARTGRVNKRRNNFALFGPKLELMSFADGEGVTLSYLARAEMNIAAYERYNKGYLSGLSGSDGKEQDPEVYNDELKTGYDLDPRVFWTKAEHIAAMDGHLVSFANYVFSIALGLQDQNASFRGWGT